MSHHVIVFGPTGNVGSITAITAQQHGAKVFLAMRDPSKPIPGLSKEQEQEAGFERVQADLTKPDTIISAIEKTGAKRAFIYVAHGLDDHMKASIEAFKKGGVEFMVFLSSYTINGNPADVKPEELIAYFHAQVELNLEAIYGDNYVALRPGSFASNVHPWYGKGLKAGKVNVLGPNVPFDMVTPEDMGSVGGYVLANGPKDGEKAIYINGPQMLTQAEILDILKKGLDKPDMEIVPVDKDVMVHQFKDAGWPAVVAEYLGGMLDHYAKTGRSPLPHYQEGVDNVVKYTGKPGLKFEDWVRQNKQSLA